MQPIRPSLALALALALASPRRRSSTPAMHAEPTTVSVNDVHRLAEFIGSKKSLTVLTGAGISKGHKPMTYQEFVSSELKRRRYWARSMRGWPFLASLEPNRIHHAIATLEKKGHIASLITQNVDGLHAKAGSHGAVELHGCLRVVTCLACRKRWDREITQSQLELLNPDWVVRWSEKDAAFHRPDGDVEIAGRPFLESFSHFTLPLCECGDASGKVKPDVVFFGENVPRTTVDSAKNAIEKADGLLVVGTSLQTLSAFRLVAQAHEKNIPIAIITMGDTRGDSLAQWKAHAPAGPLLDEAVALI